MDDLKSNLKEAKNAIKEGDFKTAMVYCKGALKIDKNNYQALVLFGKVCKELKKYEEAKKALLLAAEIEPSQPVAWQGLGSLQEQDPEVFEFSQAVKVLSHLADITTEEDKLDNIVRRKCNVYQNEGKYTAAAETMKDLTTRLSNTNHIKAAWNSIVDILSPIDVLDNHQLQLLIEALKNVVNTISVLGSNEQNYKLYLKMLYKMKSIRELVVASLDMASVFPTAYPLQWIARIYTEAKTAVPQQNDLLLDVIEEKVSKLLNLYPESPWGNAAYGLILRESGDLKSASKHFRLAAEGSPLNLILWILLLETLQQSSNVAAAEVTCRKVIEIIDTSRSTLLLPPSVTDLEAFYQTTLLTWSKMLSLMGHENHLKLALSVLQKVPDELEEVQTVRIKCLIRLKKFEEATCELDKLKLQSSSIQMQVLQANIAQGMGNIDQALHSFEDILNVDPNNTEALYGMGRLYFASNMQRSLMYFLRAAKTDSTHCGAFLYLGHYYKFNENLVKARKCYEKVLSLNPCDDEAGSSLSDVYRNLKEYDLNMTLLTNVTSGKGGSWAWLRLGLHHLALGNCEESVKALQAACQLNPNDCVSYECLGDAYLARGSHNAALRAYSKAQSMSTDGALYARGQIAYIKHLLGEYLDSINDYECVLKEDPPTPIRIVCLVGLAEVLLRRAKHYKDQMLLANVKDDSLKAIEQLSKVIVDCPDNITVWKLLSNACCLQACLPPSISQFDVPSILMGSYKEDFITISKKELLELGCRAMQVALKISESNSELWHDLGVNLYLVARCMNEDIKEMSDECRGTLQKALDCIKKSLSLNSTNHDAWDSLGVVAFFIGKHGLSQHAFLRSLKISATARTWSHFATLLLVNKESELAHQAYSQGQAVDPSFVNCWVGQAILAESMDHSSAFNLYRHSTVLGIQSESCLGFSSRVLQMCCEKQRASLNVDALLPSALDCLIYYVREYETDPYVLNMLGIAFEFMKLKHSALQTFQTASSICAEEPKLHDAIFSNKGRSFANLRRNQEAIEAFSAIKETNFAVQCAIALAKLEENNFQEAYETYLSAFNWLDASDKDKSYILVALSFLHYKCNVIEEVKTLLFQSSFSANSSVEGYAALAALGHLFKDPSLSSAALAEIESHANQPDYAHIAAFLKAAHQATKGNYQESKLILSRALHCYPQCAELWRSLSYMLLTAPPNTLSRDAEATANAAIIASVTARNLSQRVGQNEDLVLDILMQTLSWVKRASIPPKIRLKKSAVADNMKLIKKRCITEAQRSVIMCPDRIETWTVLIAALGKGNSMACKFAKLWLPKSSPSLSEWLKMYI